jgi:uncharacterized protein YndB with AHSA1/START domain
MQTIDVNTHIHVPVERVWELFSDYEGYTRLKGVSKARLLAEGREERNGVGAVREVRALGVTFVEDIVTFDAPHRLEYRVKKSTVPMQHEIGTMDFTTCGDATDVHWVSRFDLNIPFIGPILAPVLCRIFNAAFQDFLNQSKAILEE